ncbi:MAG TPA: XdhC family protein [Thermaerobacter sp.]
MEAVWSAIREALATGRAGAVATITRARGSTYRRETARMFIPGEGEPVGTISGGCLEGDVTEVARQVMADGRPRRVGYDMTADDDAIWGLGLGCNGAVEVLVEPVSPWHERVARWRDEGARVAVVTPLPPLERRDPAGAQAEVVTPGTGAAVTAPACAVSPAAGGGNGAAEAAAAGGPEAGSGMAVPPAAAGTGPGEARRLVTHADGRTEGSLGSAELDDLLASTARDWLARGRSGTVSVAGAGEFFIEAVLPPPTLLVCGAGHDAIPVVAAARPLGYRVVVADSRPAFARPERFPGAERVIHAHPEDLRRHIAIDDRTFIVIMTHNFLQDAGYLEAVLDSPAPYIGLLGPRRRAERLLAELRQRGVEPTPGQLQRLYAPVGIDIGGETPEEIAHSLLAEIQAVRYGREAGFLRDRKGPIHPREEDTP